MSKAKKSTRKPRPAPAKPALVASAAAPRAPSPGGMTRDEYLSFIARLLANGADAERVSDAAVVFWVESKTYGVVRAGRRPIHCELREDGLAVMAAPLDVFRGERSVAKALLDRNFLGSLATRSALIGEEIVQFWACNLDHVTTNEWLAALSELAALADQISIELGLTCTYQRPHPPASPQTSHGNN